MENKGGSGAFKWIIGAIVLVLVVWGLVSANKGKETKEAGIVEKGPIKIGFIGPLTGDNANIGLNAKAAVEIAIDEVNKEGGINGRTLEVVYEDGKCLNTTASSAGNKLINADKVPVILGGACSGETLSFTPMAEQNKTVIFSYCSSSPKITDAGDYVFRDYPSDNFQGSYAADYVYNKLNKKKVIVLYVKSDWGVGIKGVFIEDFKKLGGEVLMDEGFDQTSKDFRTLLTKAKALNPELVYYVGYTDTSIPAIQQARQLKLDVPFFGADAWDDPKIWSEVSNLADGYMYSVVSSTLSTDFKAKMKTKLGSEEIIVCSPGAYDGVKILAQVMKKAGTDSTEIKNELYKVNYKGGVSSPEISFDQNGDLKTANYQVKTVKNGKPE